MAIIINYHVTKQMLFVGVSLMKERRQMSQCQRRCLKCGRIIPASGWLCPDCRSANREYAPEAEGVANLYDEED